MSSESERKICSPLPELEFYNHVEAQLGTAELGQLAAHAKNVVHLCIKNPAAQEAGAPALLAELDSIEISVISDDAIAAVHADFMNDPTPTDVITFHHGEILISLDTARTRADELQQPLLREMLLYVIHGLLHLNGHEDVEKEAREQMHAIQDGILQDVWPLPASVER